MMYVKITITMLKADHIFQYETDLVRATGSGVEQDDFVSKLSRITQLTGTCIITSSFISLTFF